MWVTPDTISSTDVNQTSPWYLSGQAEQGVTMRRAAYECLMGKWGWMMHGEGRNKWDIENIWWRQNFWGKERLLFPEPR